MLVTLTLAGIVAAGTATAGAVTALITKTKTPDAEDQHDNDADEKSSLKATVEDAEEEDVYNHGHCYCDHCDPPDNLATFAELFPNSPMSNHSIKDDDYYYHDTVRVIKELHESLEEAEARLAMLEAKRSSTAVHRLNPSAAEFVPSVPAFSTPPTAYNVSFFPPGVFAPPPSGVTFSAPPPFMLANNPNVLRLSTRSPTFGDICFGCDDPAFLIPAPPSPLRGGYFGHM
ncbi:uncharacterized protein EHS24_003891 [Apiotrichum porosum]|uniref:Uncharacterized protein n=1 Tax=Apiotrichum porosum TaxID=105984 RepID=A0A427XE17_9TREE|nr:uncharacterized protein EHS24_003891 [Apiotrichum porosum]RSH76954.1 hypothetical protein EHS24_003891 [Apiotrichum porosum]